MSWKKYFSPVNTQGNMSPVGSSSGKANPSRTNYSSYLPDVYSGHPNRLERYQQYNTMDSDSEVNAALDILAEFCTQINGENGTPFEIFFKDNATQPEIKVLRKYLQQWTKLNKFNNRIFKIVRNAFKFGDCFFVRDPETQQWMYIDPAKIDKIIVNESDGKVPEQYIIRDLNINLQNLTVTQINPSNIAGTPGGTNYMVAGAQQRGMVGSVPTTAGNRFQMNQNQYAIDAKHVIHLSMSEGLDENFPFGNSLLESIFKVYKQKELLEDSIIIYRVQRAPERRVFYIDVGNMPSHLAMGFVERVKNEVNQRRIPSLTGGGTCLDMSTRIPLLDGRTLSIYELESEFQKGKINWAYSCNPETGEMVPGKITWAGSTRKQTRALKLILDNGKEIIATPDHKFPIIGKGFVEAKDIVVNEDSLISFNTRLYSINEKNNINDPQYYQVYDHSDNTWKFVHRTVAKYFKNINQHVEYIYNEEYANDRKNVIHHLDLNKYNNSPENLVFMNGLDHFRFHSEQSKYFWNNLSEDRKQEINKKRVKKTKESWNIRKKNIESFNDYRQTSSKRMKEFLAKNPNHYQRVLDNFSSQRSKSFPNQQLVWDDRIFSLFIEKYKKNSYITAGQFAKELSRDVEFMNLYRQLNYPVIGKHNRLVYDKFTNDTLRNLINSFGYNWKQFSNTFGNGLCHPERKLCWNNKQLQIAVNIAKTRKFKKSEFAKILASNTEFMKIHQTNNTGIKGNSRNDYFSENTLSVMLHNFGYKSYTDFRDKLSLYNHKIISIEYLDNLIDTGTITIDGNEEFHNYHTFAIEQGVYTKNSVIDASFNPLSINEDYFFPTTSEGRGSKVELLPGGSNLGEIDDLKYFTNKLFRALRIPSSYLPTGPDDGSSSFNDGRVGTAYIQELRFNKYCERLQGLINEHFNDEFKLYLLNKGVNVDPTLFDIKFNPPQNFAAYRQAEMDNQRVGTFSQMAALPFISPRFAMKRFLGLSQEEIAENQSLWQEENVIDGKSSASSGEELRSAGITPSGVSADLGAIETAGQPPEDMQGEMGEPNASPPLGNAGTPGAPAAPPS